MLLCYLSQGGTETGSRFCQQLVLLFRNQSLDSKTQPLPSKRGKAAACRHLHPPHLAAGGQGTPPSARPSSPLGKGSIRCIQPRHPCAITPVTSGPLINSSGCSEARSGSLLGLGRGGVDLERKLHRATELSLCLTPPRA